MDFYRRSSHTPTPPSSTPPNYDIPTPQQHDLDIHIRCGCLIVLPGRPPSYVAGLFIRSRSSSTPLQFIGHTDVCHAPDYAPVFQKSLALSRFLSLYFSDSQLQLSIYNPDPSNKHIREHDRVGSVLIDFPSLLPSLVSHTPLPLIHQENMLQQHALTTSGAHAILSCHHIDPTILHTVQHAQMISSLPPPPPPEPIPAIPPPRSSMPRSASAASLSTYTNSRGSSRTTSPLSSTSTLTTPSPTPLGAVKHRDSFHMDINSARGMSMSAGTTPRETPSPRHRSASFSQTPSQPIYSSQQQSHPHRHSVSHQSHHSPMQTGTSSINSSPHHSVQIALIKSRRARRQSTIPPSRWTPRLLYFIFLITFVFVYPMILYNIQR